MWTRIAKPQLAKAAGVKNYGTIFVEAGGRREEAKSLTEEELTSALIASLKGAAHMVCAVTGSGEHDPDDQRSGGAAAFSNCSRRTTIRPLDLVAGEGRGAAIARCW